MWGGVDTQEIQNVIKELEERKEISMDEDFNKGLDFAIRKIASLIYEDSYIIRKYGKLK